VNERGERNLLTFPNLIFEQFDICWWRNERITWSGFKALDTVK